MLRASVDTHFSEKRLLALSRTPLSRFVTGKRVVASSESATKERDPNLGLLSTASTR